MRDSASAAAVTGSAVTAPTRRARCSARSGGAAARASTQPPTAASRPGAAATAASCVRLAPPPAAVSADLRSTVTRTRRWAGAVCRRQSSANRATSAPGRSAPLVLTRPRRVAEKAESDRGGGAPGRRTAEGADVDAPSRPPTRGLTHLCFQAGWRHAGHSPHRSDAFIRGGGGGDRPRSCAQGWEKGWGGGRVGDAAAASGADQKDMTGVGGTPCEQRRPASTYCAGKVAQKSRSANNSPPFAQGQRRSPTNRQPLPTRRWQMSPSKTMVNAFEGLRDASPRKSRAS